MTIVADLTRQHKAREQELIQKRDRILELSQANKARLRNLKFQQNLLKNKVDKLRDTYVEKLDIKKKQMNIDIQAYDPSIFQEIQENMKQRLKST